MHRCKDRGGSAQSLRPCRWKPPRHSSGLHQRQHPRPFFQHTLTCWRFPRDQMDEVLGGRKGRCASAPCPGHLGRARPQAPAGRHQQLRPSRPPLLDSPVGRAAELSSACPPPPAPPSAGEAAGSSGSSPPPWPPTPAAPSPRPAPAAAAERRPPRLASVSPAELPEPRGPVTGRQRPRRPPQRRGRRASSGWLPRPRSLPPGVAALAARAPGARRPRAGGRRRRGSRPGPPPRRPAAGSRWRPRCRCCCCCRSCGGRGRSAARSPRRRAERAERAGGSRARRSGGPCPAHAA